MRHRARRTSLVHRPRAEPVAPGGRLGHRPSGLGASDGAEPPRHEAMNSASTETLLAKFENLQVWSAGDQRAPHKPLLALWAIGC